MSDLIKNLSFYLGGGVEGGIRTLSTNGERGGGLPYGGLSWGEWKRGPWMQNLKKRGNNLVKKRKQQRIEGTA